MPNTSRTTCAAGLLAVLLVMPAPADAQAAASAVPSPAVSPSSTRPFEIADNSFFVEEAFNQEPGVVQTIAGATVLQDGGWAATLTQEWPAPGMRHQLSLTALVGEVGRARGFGDLALNYRFQLLEEGAGRPAVAPRATLLCPTGNHSRGLGEGTWGLQVNVPVSKQVHDVYLHGNAGTTWYPSATPVSSEPPTSGGDPILRSSHALTSPFLAGSAIYRLRPMFHVMLESVVVWQEAFDEAPGDGPPAVTRQAIRILSPGVRGGWNHGESQYVVGAAVPVTWNGATADAGVFLYFSYEARFWRVP